MKTLIIVLLLLVSSNVKPCDCKRETFKRETDRSDLIFRGIVTLKIDSVSTSKFFYTFAISKIYKGQSQDTTALTSWNNPAACGKNLDLGKEYIIYSSGGKISQCSRTELFENAMTLPMLNYKYNTDDAKYYGSDNSDILNSLESNYLNSVFVGTKYESISKKPINVSNSKILYLINDTLVSKKKFFEMNRKYEPVLYFHKFKDQNIERNRGYIGVIYIDKTIKITQRSILNKLNK